LKIVRRIPELRRYLKKEREENKTIGFVPTMGYFHQGHLSLMERAREENEVVVVSSFVNPTQFGPGEDYEFYPRDEKSDCQKAEEKGVDYFFAPSVEEMYPEANFSWVEVEKLSEPLCGQFRPGHFRGVATVVTKLFNIVQPDVAYFGEKDYQQLLIIKKMVGDLNFPIKIVGCPTVREKDGLPMSSRNSYLNSQEREAASLIPRALREAARSYEAGEKEAAKIVSLAREILTSSPLIQIEYIEVRDPTTLKEVLKVKREALFQLSVRIGRARLIDHIVLGRKETYV